MTDRKQRAATVGDPTSSSFTTHPLEFTEIDLGPISESTVAPLANEDALIEIEPAQQAADIPEDAPSVIWDLPPPDFNGPSPDAAPPAYDEALTCGTECPPLPRHPYQDDFAFDLEDSRRNAEMRLELALIKANRKKMYINFILGILFFLIILIICRFTFFDTSKNYPPTTTISTILDITSTDDPEQQ
ncbi:hypothetical protein PRIPAC_97587 [Pristionchus pacificus]|uniref:Uncharacterized protein n=1 Tax=Pristionchus pacificus TaxID=54126 RepID=A0A2A6D302_PRIPA|nr:hypothetical protein PRIPAC_97587 [Pristionchus pacificus]|eukprot:PDM84778.1 hypothetical protein PRIPAC_33801 [Pristionchus pacificus]